MKAMKNKILMIITAVALCIEAGLIYVSSFII